MKKIKRKLLAAAIALIGFSTASAVTGTVAWFTAANTVSVSGMQIQAETEEGIVIANETHTADSHWLTSVNASHNGSSETFVVTSTADAATWYHAYAIGAGESTTNAYDTLSVTESSGLGSATIGTSPKNIYLLNKFYIQASSKNSDIDDQDIYLTQLATTVTGSNSEELNKTLRLAVVAKQGGSVVSTNFFAPITAAAYTKNTSTTYHPATVITPASASAETKIVDNIDIPEYVTTGHADAIEFNVYVFFDGDDDRCASINIPVGSLDNIAISFALRNKDHAA